MHIVLACGSMIFGPDSAHLRSLGGSEMAALQLSKALAARGHQVHLFCNLPAPTDPDFWPDNVQHTDGVFYHSLANYGLYVNSVEHDLTIGVRDPRFMLFECKSKKKVLWAHDIFTKRGMGKALSDMEWTFDEIWTVSEWHRQQVYEATGYPLNHIVALRNGIVKYSDILSGNVSGLRAEKKILYASRPERGLENLIRPGGVMDNLPEYTLVVAMYEHFPEHMADFYRMIFERMKAMPNVEFVGGKSNHDLRDMIAQSAAYIYPTQFEETSCILARECIEQGTPFLTTKVGALPETLGASGVYFEDYLTAKGIKEPEKGSPEWCALFADFFRDAMEVRDTITHAQAAMNERDDLYWDGVASMVEDHGPVPDAHVQQSVAAAIIAYNNEDTILRCLNSLVGNVDAIQIAMGPSTDHTTLFVEHFARTHPEIKVGIKGVPKIEPYKFGFDDARNASVEGLEGYDWIFWIDTDEYLVGNLRKYLRNNALDSYLISQHHFTVEPRGAPTQIDRPARLYRNGVGFKCLGHIHEHFELPDGGPGRGYLVPDIDIGHTGYENETVRKARFERNWPFLKWEHEEGSGRKLNSFLWFRDIVHRMRFAFSQNDKAEGVKLALEGEKYYHEHQPEFAAFGPGLYQSLAYLTEIYNVLGKGVPIRTTIQLDDRNTVLEGKFADYAHFDRVVRQIVEPEFNERASRYY